MYCLHRIKEEAQANLMNVQSVYELRAILLAEKKNMEREQRDMAKEEVRIVVIFGAYRTTANLTTAELTGCV